MNRRRRNRGGGFDEGVPSATISLEPRTRSRSFFSFCSWDFGILAFVIFIASCYMFLYIYMNPTIDKLPPISGPDYDSKQWGSYRPHLYFGLRTRSPQSPLFGMMWYESQLPHGRPQVRHWCDQNDGINRYGWYEADGRSFGKQNISDKFATIHTDWIQEANGFKAKINFDLKPGKIANVLFYLTSQDNTVFKQGYHLNEVFKAKSEFLGDFKLSIELKDERALFMKSVLLTNEKVPINMYQDIVVGNSEISVESNPGSQEKMFFMHLNEKVNERDGRMAVVQLNLIKSTEIYIKLGKIENQGANSDFEKEIQKKSQNFKTKFEKVFEIENKNYTAVQKTMAKVALSNMLGGIGYWNGFNKVQTSSGLQNYGPHTLFSAVPSRPFFPRGFLWDEGFHNMLIRKFDPKLSLEIVVSWMNLMEQSGWIPREMILGPEAEARVPQEYIAQKMDVANPPSLFYVIDKLVHDEKVVAKYGGVLAKIYPRLEKWFFWLRGTQHGTSKTTFRWRGRNETTNLELNPKTLSSGLDDYPRASHPSDIERHLDLRCWLALCARVLERLSKFYGTDADHRKFSKHMEELNDFDQLVQDHWSEEHQGFYDYGKHSEDVALAMVPVPGPKRVEYQRVTARAATNKFVTNVYGYNSLYPLMLRLIPADSKHLKATLDKIRDPKLLWTKFGLRSVSKTSPYYQARNTEHDPPYWRGYIWININYMVLSALRHYADIDGPYRENAENIFGELRKNLVENMGKQFDKTGYIWENYDDSTGQGRGSHPFNGWSSLILMIMSDKLET
ncbi:unnamed protein product [Caenorhabditis angaria]|uniref:Mannosyl-oligosaccharide glucosidase n=1 Tax=Caenorhabditis angaria TaxID=860376 RepID=A0A9P1N2W5_9PELO|nr:unnamed protein product [Caenorhabditis angaria]